jgi:hypothetical protein
MWNYFSSKRRECEITFLRNVVNVKLLIFETSWMWNYLSSKRRECEITYLRNVVNVKLLIFETSLMWNYLSSKRRECEITFLRNVVNVKLRTAKHNTHEHWVVDDQMEICQEDQEYIFSMEFVSYTGQN